MDELYYSNPQNNLDKINLYGTSPNYDIHKDCFFDFYGIKFYRVLIGLTGGNNNVITYFNNLDVKHKINTGDFIVFDFGKTVHQVIKDKEENTPRILLKLHYIICEDCNYSKNFVENIKQVYLYYEFITRAAMEYGTDPETFPQFFAGVAMQFFSKTYNLFLVLLIICLIIISIKYVCKIDLAYKNISKITKYILIILIILYILIILFYWGRYKLYRIR
jgi:hypothetical protein